LTAINKPQSATTVLHSTAEIGLSGKSFNLKVTSFDISVNSPLIDATSETTAADQNKFPNYRHSGRANGTCTMSGFSVNAQLIGFANLPDEAVMIYLTYAEGATIKFQMAMENLSMKYDRQQAGVMVQLTGKINGKISGANIAGGTHNPIQETIA
jgi:hypothetical protein